MRRLVKTLALLGLMVPTLAQALGLGDIEVKSALGQPLDAEIELVSVTAADLGELNIRLASPEDFRRAGVDQAPFLSTLVFRTVTRDGVHFVRITTDAPVSEPFLNFLVEAQWSSGRLVREYTLLLDPPLLHEQRRAVATQAPAVEAAPPTPAPVTRPALPPAPVATAPRPAPTPAPAPTSGLTPGESRHKVQADETLLGVARRVRPGTGASLEQIMMALLRANPEAFIEDNINLLRMGQVLRIPDRDALTAVGREEAVAEVATQNALWREYRTRTTEMPMAQEPVPLAPSKPAAPKPEVSKPEAAEGSLKLVAPTAQPQPAPAAGISENEQALRNQIGELERTLQERESMLLVLNEQLAELQRRLGDLEARLEPEAVAPAAEPAPAAAPPKAEPKPKPAPPSAPAPRHESAGLMDEIMNDPKLFAAAGGGLLLVLALLWLLVRRARAGRGQTLADMTAASAVSTHPGLREEPAIHVDNSAFGSSTGEPAATEAEVAESINEEAGEAETESVEETRFANDDIIAEADVFIAYGLYNQAEDLLKRNIEQHPNRNEYRQKLLESYFASRSIEPFEAAAKDLLERLGGDETAAAWKKVADMGRRLDPANPLYGSATRIASEPESVRASFAGEGEEPAPLEDEPPIAIAESVVHPEEPADEADFNFENLLFGETASESATDEGEPPSLPEINYGDSGVADVGVESPSQEAAEALHESPLMASEDDLASLELPAFEIPETVVEQQTAVGEDLESMFKDLAMEAPEEETAEMQEELPVADLSSIEGIDNLLSEAPATEAPIPEVMALDESPSAESEPQVEAKSESEPEAEAVSRVSLPEDLNFGLDSLDLDFEAGEEEADESGVGVAGEDDLSGDEIDTKLDLARAYVEMGDREGARSALEEIVQEGSESQKQQAEELLRQLD